MTPTQPRTQVQRWRSPLLLATLAGLLFALLSGSVLLFFGMAPQRREYWVLIHWSCAMLGLVPYAVYQLRHYLRMRAYVQQTHYRVGLHAFFAICGTLLTGLPLVTPLASGTRIYSIVDLAHIFFGFVFTLLLSAHLTLVAVLTIGRVALTEAQIARSAVRYLIGSATAAALMILIAAITNS